MKKRVLVTGATGYIGGRLIRPLLENGYRVRCMARRPENLRLGSDCEVVQGDAFDPESLGRALDGVDVAFYLIHSLGLSEGWQERDRQAAENFGRAAADAGVDRVIYLGGLGSDLDLSEHLSSRQEVGAVLRASGVSTIEFRASIVIGSGSLSYEMIRALSNRLPVMLMPKWIRVKAQPIAIEDVLAYLLAAIEIDERIDKPLEIGGTDRVSYLDIMREYARQRGLKRFFIPVPVLTPRLSSLWLGLVTPLYARVGRKLIDSVFHETIVQDDTAERVFQVHPRGVRKAIERALVNEDREIAETRWSDAVSSLGAVPNWAGVKFGSRNVDTRSAEVDASPEQAFKVVRRVGGETGWYYANWAWRLRGFVDLLFGGAGMRRGRRDAENLAVGDVVDWWRVEEVEPDRRIRLLAEMKTPGRAWLQFDVEPAEQGSVIRQTAIFDPRGLFGLFYWYVLYIPHKVIFQGMLRSIAQRAEKET